MISSADRTKLTITTGATPNADQTINSFDFQKFGAIANKLNDESGGVRAKLKDAITKWPDTGVPGDVKIAGIVALVSFGVIGILGLIYGIVLCSTLDVHDEDLLVIIRNFGISLAITSLIPISFGVVIANNIEKHTLHGYTDLDAGKTKRGLKDLSTGNTPSITGFGNSTNQTQDHAKNFAKGDFVASVGIGEKMLMTRVKQLINPRLEIIFLKLKLVLIRLI